MESKEESKMEKMESKEEAKYHQTFTLDQEAEIKAHFLEHGYVAVRDLLSRSDCKATLDEMNDMMKQLNTDFDLFDATTYEHAPIINNFGLHAKKPIFTPAFLNNRQNPGIAKIFSLLLVASGSDDKILVNHDRCAFYRPTAAPSGKPEWRTAYTFPGLHLDFHPSSYFQHKDLLMKREMFDYKTTDDFIAENNLFCEDDGMEIQAVINLLDNAEQDGGYQCMPGFHKNFQAWCQEKKEREEMEEKKSAPLVEGVYHFSKVDKIDMKYAADPIRVPVPQGTVIFWSQFLAHGTKPNNSCNPRCIQFIKAFPKKMFSKERLKKRAAAMKKIFKENAFVPSKIGRAVFGV